MPSMMDHVADKNGVELVRLSGLYTFPDFVKQADLGQTLGQRRLPAHLYADPVRQQFPCDTAASTWLSALYFTEKRAEFHPKDQALIQKRVDGYASYWRIKAAVDSVKARWQELHKTAEEQLPDRDFAYVWAGDDGRKERHLRLTNAMEVKAAAEYVEEYRDRFPFSARHAMARKILEKAAHFGAAVGANREFLERQAGWGVCDPAEVVKMVEDRAMLVPAGRGVTVKFASDGKEERSEGLREHFLKMAAVIRASPRRALLPEMLVKLAETVDALDRQLGLVGKYSEGLPRPEDVIFKATFSKTAGEMTRVVPTTSGKVYEKSALKKLALDDLTAMFGREFSDRVKTPLGEIDPEKMAEEVATLPRPDAELLDGLLSDNGVRPLLTKAASAHQGFTREEMNAWAAAYRTVG
jgi:hypothetical protein